MMRDVLLKLKGKFNDQYYREDYLVSMQAYYLLLTCLITVTATVIVFGINLFLYFSEGIFNWSSPLLTHLFIDLMLIVLFSVGIWILLKGDYYFASILTGIGAVSIVIIAAALNIENFMYTGFNSFLYLFYAAALFISFFALKELRILLSVALLLVNGVLYAIVLIQSKTIFIREVIHSMMNSEATLLVVLFVGFYFVQMVQQVIMDKQEAIESKNDLKHRLENKVMLRTQELVEYNQQLENEIRKRNSVEAALKESEIRYRTIFENSGTAICIIDSSGLIALCNNEFCRMSGYTKMELEGKISWTKFVHHDDFKRIYHFMTDIQMKSQYETQTDFKLIDRYGRQYELSINIERISAEQQLIVSLLDITEKNSALKRLQLLASVDPLTELYNRRYFMEHFDNYLSHAIDGELHVGVLYLDIDNFKHINDTYGHGVGDDLLHDVSQRLKKLVEPSGLAARIGGDEFVMLMLAKDQEIVIKRVEKFMRDMELPFVYGSLVLSLSFSVGISMYPVQGHQGETLINQADEAMYIAKARGKNQYAMFGS